MVFIWSLTPWWRTLTHGSSSNFRSIHPPPLVTWRLRLAIAVVFSGCPHSRVRCHMVISRSHWLTAVLSCNPRQPHDNLMLSLMTHLSKDWCCWWQKRGKHTHTHTDTNGDPRMPCCWTEIDMRAGPQLFVSLWLAILKMLFTLDIPVF